MTELEKRSKDQDFEMFSVIVEGDIRQSFACKDRSINIRENGDLEIVEIVHKGKDFEAKRTETCFYSPKGKWISYTIYMHSTIYPNEYK